MNERILSHDEAVEKLKELMELITRGGTLVATEDDDGRIVFRQMDDLQWEAGTLGRNAEFLADLQASRTGVGEEDKSISLAELTKIHEDLAHRERLSAPE